MSPIATTLIAAASIAAGEVPIAAASIAAGEVLIAAAGILPIAPAANRPDRKTLLSTADLLLPSPHHSFPIAHRRRFKSSTGCSDNYWAKEDGDKPGLVAMLQKVLQLYASVVLCKRSYAYKGGEVIIAEKFLESMIEAPEESWNKLLIEGLTLGKGKVSPEKLKVVIKKRIERILIRTAGGSYQQRIQTEYLKGIQSRTEEVVQALQGQQQ